jgi:capsular polysaccharide biosynthesis protein
MNERREMGSARDVLTVLFILALILGCVSGLGLAFFSEYAGQSLSTPEAAEKRLDIQVLGSIEHKG